MTSILTNNSAMIALQNLRQTNNSLGDVQSQISTGKKYATAKDNAAIWSIAAVMESDVSGFKGVSDALALGESTVAVARSGAEAVTDLLNQMKERIVAAQADNVDRDKVDADVQALKEQISATVSGSQFNGLNLLDGSAGATVDVLSSLNRAGGAVTSDDITINTQDLTTTARTLKAATEMTGTDGLAADGAYGSITLDGNGGTNDDMAVTLVNTVTYAEGDVLEFNVGSNVATYTVTADDLTGAATADDVNNVAAGLAGAINSAGFGMTVTVAANALTLTNTDATQKTVEFGSYSAGAGGLAALNNLNVSTQADAAQALSDIDGLIDIATSAASSFGSAQKRIEIQSEFIKDISDNLKSGIGAIADADMEEASARLQALQVQQQLGGQALSIANQQPQGILSLFR
jgi:flagellin